MMDPKRSCFSKCILAASILLGWSLCAGTTDTKNRTPTIPKVWDEAALADWVTPLAGLNVRPTHVSEKEYYSMPESILRSYPVYMPGREPEGYWDMLQHIGPKPLIQPETLKTEADWIEAGRRVFADWDKAQMRTFDPKLIAAARSREGFREPPPNGHPTGRRWT